MPPAPPLVGRFVLTGLLTILCATAQAEVWTDLTGKFSIEAKFIGVEGSSIVLLKEDGSKINVPIARLSEDSRKQAKQFYQEMLQASAQPATSIDGSAEALPPSTTRSLNFKPPVPPSIKPIARFPDDLSVRETIDFMKQQLMAGHPEVFWNALPDSMRETMDDPQFRSQFSPFVQQKSPIQSQIEPLAFKAIQVLVTKKSLVLGSPMLEQIPGEARPQISQAYDPAVGAIYEFADMAFSFDIEGERSITQIVNYHSPRIGGHLSALMPLLPPGSIDQFFDSLEIEQIDDDHAVVRMQKDERESDDANNEFSFELTSDETKLVRIDNRWVTQELHDQWQQLKTKLESGELKQEMAALQKESAGDMQGATMMVGMFAGMASTVLDAMLAADTQEEFNQAVAQVTALANMGPGIGGDQNADSERELGFGSGADFGNFGTLEEMDESESTPKTLEPTGPAPEGWTLDLSDVKIPDQPAAGAANGKNAIVTDASFDNGILHLTHRENRQKVNSWVIFTFLKDDETIEGKTFDINPKTGFGSPHVHFHFQDLDGVSDTEMFMSKYAMRLEFGKIAQGKLPGKIYLCLPDANKSLLRGTFVATVK